MSNNGIILIDDYAVEVGATKAIDEIKKLKLKIGYHDHCSYIVCKKKFKDFNSYPARKNLKRLPNKIYCVNKSLIQRDY